jgi:D-ala D-ala ligase N-terminal domain protein
MRIKVGFIFGGESVEHEVSIISAIQAMNKIDEEKYEVVPIYITKDREWYTGELLKDIEVYQDLKLLKKYAKNVVLYYKNGSYVLQTKGLFKRIVNTIDIAFPVVHGTNVEDGVLQGYLQSIGIPFVGSNVYASVVGQDKVYMKNIWEKAGLNMAKYTWFYDYDYRNNQDKILKEIDKIGYPVVVKPATTGSSVGIGVASTKDEIIDAIDEAIQYDSKIIVEEKVENLKEVNIAVMGNYERQKLSAIEEVMSSNKFLTFDDKYIGNGKSKGKFKVASKGMASLNRKLPADLSKEVKEKVEDMAINAFKVLGTSGNARIDFMINSKTNKVYINEINSIPGSLAFYLWEEASVSFTDLLDEMINIGIKDYKKRSAKIHSFDSNILSGFAKGNGLKGKGKGKLK